MKKIKNIEGKNEEQLKAIEDQGKKQLEELKNIDKSKTLEIIDKISEKNNEANKVICSSIYTKQMIKRKIMNW